MVVSNKFTESTRKTFVEQATILTHAKFLDSFLILSLLVSIFNSERKLPSTKLELYKRCYEYVSKEREIAKLVGHSNYNTKLLGKILTTSIFKTLSALAAPNNHNIERNDLVDTFSEEYKRTFNSTSETEEAIEAFFAYCSERTELLVLSDGDNLYRFVHISFFEFFYALYIADKENEERMKLLSKLDFDSEVFILLTAYLKDNNEKTYQAFIDHVMSSVSNDISAKNWGSRSLQMLTLMMQTIDDASYISLYFYLTNKYFTECPENENTLYRFGNNVATLQIKELRMNAKKKVEFLSTYGQKITHRMLTFFYSLSKSEDFKKEFIDTDDIDMKIIYNEYRSYSVEAAYSRLPYFVNVALCLGYVEELLSKADEYFILGSQTHADNTMTKAKELLMGFEFFKNLTVNQQQVILSTLKSLVPIS